MSREHVAVRPGLRRLLPGSALRRTGEPEQMLLLLILLRYLVGREDPEQWSRHWHRTA